ncbi:MAG: hypothetical protein ACR2PS_06395, partial [Pseudomonadales bacterium]
MKLKPISTNYRAPKTRDYGCYGYELVLAKLVNAASCRKTTGKQLMTPDEKQAFEEKIHAYVGREMGPP